MIYDGGAATGRPNTVVHQDSLLRNGFKAVRMQGPGAPKVIALWPAGQSIFPAIATWWRNDMMAGDTLFHKIWKQHVIADLGDGYALLHVDRHMLHELGARSLVGLRKRGLPLHDPELTFATADHCISTNPADVGQAQLDNNPYVQNIRQGAGEFGFRLFDVGKPGFGIVHVIAPALGVALPGITMACGDSHTCTIGALDANATSVVHGGNPPTTLTVARHVVTLHCRLAP